MYHRWWGAGNQVLGSGFINYIRIVAQGFLIGAIEIKKKGSRNPSEADNSRGKVVCKEAQSWSRRNAEQQDG